MTEINQHPEVLLYPRIRKSPYFYASRRHGVQRYGFYNHMYHPRHYGDPVEEYWQLLNGVTLWDVGVERQVEITGPDAFTLANMLVPRDLNKCAVGQCKYVFITAPDGGIINDPILLRLDENHFWLSVADSDVLLAAVFTRDLGRGLRFAEAARAGWVNVNESTNYWESHLPFGGRAGSQSGIGRVGGRFSMETFTELKTVVVNLG